VAHEISPTARALLALEAIQNPGHQRDSAIGERLGVTERAARSLRSPTILSEAGMPIEARYRTLRRLPGRLRDAAAADHVQQQRKRAAGSRHERA